MKKLFLVIFVISFISNAEIFACGTVKAWVEIYFKSKNQNSHYKPKNVLMNIHCEPVLNSYKYNYHGNKSQNSKLLIEMIEDALENNDVCIKNLAVKNFFIFKELHTFYNKNENYKRVKQKIENYLRISFDNRKAVKISEILEPYEWVDRNTYCSQIQREIHIIKYY